MHFRRLIILISENFAMSFKGKNAGKVKAEMCFCQRDSQFAEKISAV